MTTEHHPLCDDNGWDHPNPCVVETEILNDIIGPEIRGWCKNAIDDWYAAHQEPRTVDALSDAGGLLVDIIRTVILGEPL
jgi:hypothetical protein